MQSALDPAVYLYFNDGGRIPPRTAAHSLCTELKHIMSAPTLLTDCARLCSPAPAVSKWVLLPGRHRSIRGVSFPPFPSLLPFARSLCSDPQKRPLSSPFNTSSLLRIVFLACKLPRLICCDRSNLLGKAEVRRESSPPNFPKPLQSFHSVTELNATEKDSLKGSKDLRPNPRIHTEVQLHLLQ